MNKQQRDDIANANADANANANANCWKDIMTTTTTEPGSEFLLAFTITAELLSVSLIIIYNWEIYYYIPLLLLMIQPSHLL
jgi:hypothetical protein